MHMVRNLADYIEMTKMNYDEVVQKLIDKYGPATDDYYRESSYQRFLNGDNKTITKGKISRASEGLYCHHIDENELDNLSNNDYIAHFGYDFAYQRSNRLVYCNLVEHMILHFLIAIETKGSHGLSGFEMIRASVYDYYVTGIHEFKLEWRNIVYEEAYLSFGSIFIFW